jgi:hypothetical protein
LTKKNKKIKKIKNQAGFFHIFSYNIGTLFFTEVFYAEGRLAYDDGCRNYE